MRFFWMISEFFGFCIVLTMAMFLVAFTFEDGTTFELPSSKFDNKSSKQCK
jgi:hypothetical protein